MACYFLRASLHHRICRFASWKLRAESCVTHKSLGILMQLQANFIVSMYCVFLSISFLSCLETNVCLKCFSFNIDEFMNIYHMFSFSRSESQKNSGPLFEVHRPAAGFGALPVLAETKHCQFYGAAKASWLVGCKWLQDSARTCKDMQGQGDNSSTIGSIGPRGFERHNIQSTA